MPFGITIPGVDETPLMRKVAYEPEIIIKCATCGCKFEFKVDLKEWIFSTDSINSFYVYRMPIMKAASFSLITFAMPPIFYSRIDADIQRNIFPDIRIRFNLANMEKRVSQTSFEKLPAGITLTGKVIHALPRTHFTSQTKIVPVSLYVCQTVIHQMMLGNSFNKIFENITAYNALKKFESKMESRYGKESIKFDHMTVSENMSDYKYENILIKSANDLTVPSVIHTTYKPINHYSYYFFDDFDPCCGVPVVGRLRDLSKPLGETWNIFEDKEKYDVARTLRSKGKVHIGDRQEGFRPKFNDASTYIRNSKSEIRARKDAKEVEVIQTPPQHEKGNVYDRLQVRPVLNNLSQTKTTEKKSNKHASYYTPDSLDFAKTRNDNFYAFLKNITDAIYKFEAYEVNIDAIQLYRKYTLDQTDLKSFYVPINIINIFSRINPHETPVNHTAQFQTIKYPGSPVVWTPPPPQIIPSPRIPGI